MTHRVLAVCALLLAVAAAFAGAPAREPAYIAARDVARHIIDGDDIRIHDLRDSAAFERLHLPGARLSSAGDVVADNAGGIIVLYGEPAADAWRALHADARGNAFVLRGGVHEWLSEVMEPRLAVDATEEERAAFVDAAVQSRYFGGAPRTNVPRAELVQTEEEATAAVTRRGCE